MLLTEQEIEQCFNESDGTWRSAYKRIEAKLLEKLKAQEPFGYFKAEAFCWTDCAETDDGAKPLYEHPLPPDDVVRIAELEATCVDHGEIQKALCERAAELEAVLRECRDEILARAWGLPYNFDELVAKIDEVLNGKE